MFVELLVCSNSEFSKRRFLLDSDTELNLIRQTTATEAVINVARSQAHCRILLSQYVRPPGEDAAAGVERRRRVIVSAMDKASTALKTAFAGAAEGQLDLPQIHAVAADARAAIDASPDLFLEVTRLRDKDEATYRHSLSVSAMMARLGESIGLDEAAIDELALAGLLHDVGKVLIPTEILNKPGKLSAQEWALVRAHPEIGHRLLQGRSDISKTVLDICRLHHECLDGSGYPLGLRGEQISLPVRLATVCDVFDALTSLRPYKRTWTTAEAVRWMFENSRLFDSKLVLALGAMFR